MTEPTTAVPTIALNSLQAAITAEHEVHAASPSAWDLPPDKLDTTIKLHSVEKLIAVLDAAEKETPKFLNGILLTPYHQREIWDLSRTIQHDLLNGARHEHSSNVGYKASSASLAGMLSALIPERKKDGV